MGTGEVTLRDVEEADLAIFFAHQQEAEANRMAAFPARGREAFAAHWARILADEGVETQAIVADGQVVGNVVSFEHDGRREVGYWIGMEHRGKGIATCALAQFLARETTRPLYAGVATHNAASVRVLEKCGFAVCGEEGEMLLLVLSSGGS